MTTVKTTILYCPYCGAHALYGYTGDAHTYCPHAEYLDRHPKVWGRKEVSFEIELKKFI